MREIIYTEDALADLAVIWSYTANEWSIEQADRYIQSLEAECIKIAHGEAILRHFEPPYEHISFRRYAHHYIFCLQDNTETIIIAFLHERMEAFQRLNDRLA